MKAKRLVLRLGSLGDVILASSVLEVSSFVAQSEIDWVVASDFKDVLSGHPKIKQLFEFERSEGLRSWTQLCRTLWKENYSEVFDLHRSLRTRLMRALFLYWSFVERSPSPKWKSISKQRLRLYLYYLFKNLFPKICRPSPWVTRYTKAVGGTGEERPCLNHLSKGQILPPELLDPTIRLRKFICVMPSSRWNGKKWPVLFYALLLKKIPFLPVILGRKSDIESVALQEELHKMGVPYFSVVGSSSLSQTARILQEAVCYIGSDTGLAHLAEAVGTPAKVILGPTTSDMGFGLWKEESQSLGLSLWCRPCGKDGRYCYRISQKHLCLKGLSVEFVSKTCFPSIG